MYKVENLKYDCEGNCDGVRNDWVWCGYCDKCNYLAKASEKGEEEWRKWNWECTMLSQMKIKKARAKALKELYISTDNENCLKHTFLTIALPEDYSLPDMVKTVEKVQSKDLYGLGDSIASYEWYSEKKPEGGNLHVHLLAVNNTKKYKPSVIAKKIAKLFNIETNFVDVVNGNEDFLNRLNYVCGQKCEGKVACNEKDREWRKREGLPGVTSHLPELLEQKHAELIKSAA